MYILVDKIAKRVQIEIEQVVAFTSGRFPLQPVSSKRNRQVANNLSNL
jgi:hypothetical protein